LYEENEVNLMAKTKTAKADTTTKAPAKKSPKSKTPAKRDVPKGILRAPDHHHFVLVDGRRLGDVKELADALEDMAEHVWAHHVTHERNDFATWINDIFTDAELAERLRAAAGKHHAQIVLYRAILERI
jgi:hypothetical protein